MRLTRLASAGFRNLDAQSLDTDARFVVFHGDNAQGKTNALEAIYLLATLKPLRGHRVREVVVWGSDEATVAGTCEGEIRRNYRVDLTASGRLARVDGKRVELAEYFAGIRVIAFTPADAGIVGGEPARRRAWLDRAAFTAAPAHLDVVRSYRRCLAQKAAALRERPPDITLLDAIDQQLAAAGAALVSRRVAVLRDLTPHIREVHATIAGGSPRLELVYVTAAAGDDPEERAGRLAAKLAQVRAGELRRRITLAGPQTDELKVVLDGHVARSFGSQGQVRSLVLALKLAELLAARARGDVPIFLLDDVSSELDRGRSGRLVGLLEAVGGQVFATTTDARHLGALPSAETKVFSVVSGTISG